ncbi:MAG: IS66 family transposase [Bryobacteraceae bacterium]|nr:IS66 family transposase [Bryobacteraceae bacterium]MCW5983348.1 IS66 family transposase [Bryobacteraceae bacterium]
MVDDLEALDRAGLIRLIHELLRQNEELRQLVEQLRRQQHRSAAPFSKGKRKPNPQKPGRKPGQGEFRRRAQPAAAPNHPPVDVPVAHALCRWCGGALEAEAAENVSVTDLAPRPQPVIRVFRIQVCRCRRCGRTVRGQHPEVAADQHGATAHRLGPGVRAMAHALHYGHGVPVRRLPAILREMTGIALTSSAITQDALKQLSGAVGQAYQRLRKQVRNAAVVYTDDTGWRVDGESAFLMAFDTDEQTAYQVRRQHGNEQVRELVPGDYGGTLVTDRGPSYNAAELSGVKQHKCLSHLIGNVTEVVASKSGAAKAFGARLKTLLQQANQLWRDRRAGKAMDYQAEVNRIEQELTRHLRIRRLRDPDNQRLLDGIGLQHDRSRVLTFLHHPDVEPTNNRAERALRPAVIARKVSHCSKNTRGAEAFAAFTSVARTAVKKGGASVAETFRLLLRPKPLPEST